MKKVLKPKHLVFLGLDKSCLFSCALQLIINIISLIRFEAYVEASTQKCDERTDRAGQGDALFQANWAPGPNC